MVTTAWYYDYFESATFPHQQNLCEAVAWTKYNLEGQIASKTSLTRSPGNPLTIRLLAVKEALKKLEDYIGELDLKIKTQAEKQFKTNKFFSMGGTFYGKDSLSDSSGAPIEKIEIEADGKKIILELKWVTIHLALYEFFTNFGSVMDRLAYEINVLYELNEKKIDWPKLIDKRKNNDKVWKSLCKKDEILAVIIEDYSPKFKTANLYRNRLVHDGLIDFNPDISFRGINIFLGQNPDDNTSPMDVNAIEFCKQTKTDMLGLLDKSYDLMIQYYNKSSDRRET